MPRPAGQARPETLFAPIVERRFLVAGFFAGVVARAADKTDASQVAAVGTNVSSADLTFF
jgi:hypothetical protein